MEKELKTEKEVNKRLVEELIETNENIKKGVKWLSDNLEKRIKRNKEKYDKSIVKDNTTDGAIMNRETVVKTTEIKKEKKLKKPPPGGAPTEATDSNKEPSLVFCSLPKMAQMDTFWS
jgi:hypothetical protein